ncbi:ribose-phosphate diphosphokinase [candidate division KSB1 bacterium]|nr:ribose-phosphate diphosphokinase [candidate division KSB1 bacterium]MBL7093679.1 ribose-phosphate diphosphokinase [candidate division KSB1 bacterium]
MPAGEMKIFSGTANPELAKKICAHLSICLSKSKSFQFSEGNIYVNLLENVRRKEIFFIQSGCVPVNDLIMETLFYIDAFKRSSASTVTVVLPFFPYTKGDKKDEPRVSIRAKVISEIIEATGADRLLTLDLQPPQIQGFFKIPVDNLYAMPVFCDYLKELNIPDLIIAAPDFGAAKMADNFAHRLNAPVALGSKQRHGHVESVQITNVIGDVKDKNVVIVDDMIISGGTICEMGKMLKSNGALKIYACVTHALLSDEFIQNIEDCSFDELIITDTFPQKETFQHPKIKRLSVAHLLSEAISSIYNGDPLSKLFSGVNLIENNR